MAKKPLELYEQKVRQILNSEVMAINNIDKCKSLREEVKNAVVAVGKPRKGRIGEYNG